MTNDFIGFDFLPSSMHPTADIRRGYVATPAAIPDMGATGKAGVVMTVDTTAGHGVMSDQHLMRLDF